jgi:hypothetical protein
LSVPFLDLKGMRAVEIPVVVEFVPIGDGCHERAGKRPQGMEIYAVNCLE